MEEALALFSEVREGEIYNLSVLTQFENLHVKSQSEFGKNREFFIIFLLIIDARVGHHR